MVHDQIRHHVAPGSDGADVVPRSDARVDGRVVDRVEPGVSAVDRDEEGQDVDAAEHPAQLTVEQPAKSGEVTGQAVGVGDQLRSGGPVHSTDAMARGRPWSHPVAPIVETSDASREHRNGLRAEVVERCGALDIEPFVGADGDLGGDGPNRPGHRGDDDPVEGCDVPPRRVRSDQAPAETQAWAIAST